MTSPYSDLPPRAFWRSAVAERLPLDMSGLYQRKFKIGRKTRIVTAGSCFAQHVGRALRGAGFQVLDYEKGPAGVETTLKRFGYGLYSARYGNIYTVRQLRQLLAEAFDGLQPAYPVWERDGRYFDAFRPTVEPEGLPSPEAVAAHRADHLAAVRQLFRDADLFVFTFGLTEAWVARSDGTVYPTAPGTVAGSHDPAKFAFRNYRYAEILSDFKIVRKKLRSLNPRMRFLVTVSPVPLTATASGQHVEVASTYSKAVLRAVCGDLAHLYKDVDYFPSFEVITSQTARGTNFEPNMRGVTPEGVARAMGLFMAAHDTDRGAGATGSAAGSAQTPARPAKAARKPASARPKPAIRDDDVVCEEVLLDAFAR